MYGKTLKWLVFAILMQRAMPALSQICFPAKKLHAYLQPVTRGIESRSDATPRPAGNYYLYIESKKPGISLGTMWIKGEVFSGQLKDVASPVVLEGTVSNSVLMKGEAPVELVPATRKRVYQVVLTAHEPGKIKIPLPAQYAAKAVVLELHYKSRKRFVSANEFKPLKLEARY